MPTIMVDPSTVPTAVAGTPPESPAGHKAPPVCLDFSLMSSAMTTDALSELIFASNSIPAFKPDEAAMIRVLTQHTVTDVSVPVSSSSSTCTRESDTLSDAEGNGHLHLQQLQNKNVSTSATGAVLSQVVDHTSDDSTRSVGGCNNAPLVTTMDSSRNKWNAKVSLMKTSRQGRSSQRWLVDSGEMVRLVTGCVPILKSGKILFISSSRQSEWILPKGGWEKDEAMEESAVRECFEEAGVLGTLGPPLKEVQYETRKAKKRRLEQEEMRTKRLKEVELLPTSVSDEFVAAASSPGDKPLASPSLSPAATGASATTPHSAVHSPFSNEDLTRIRWLAQQNAPKVSDETASVASNVSSAHSHVRMTLFPLYVTDVHDDWPERGRLRTAVDIDQAIVMMDARPEFKMALEEVKARGLHLVPQEETQQQPPLPPSQP